MTSADHRTTTILIVDDEEVVLSLVKDALEDQPATILTAPNAQKAIDILNQQSVDLLITDIRMPEMDGLELAHHAGESQPNIKTIFMTGYANLHTAKNAIQHGAIDYILKPFELKEIREAVQRAICLIETSKSQNPEKHLTQLTGLRDVLSQADDHRSAALSSLHCGLMQTGSRRGFIAYRTTLDGPLLILSIEDERASEPKIHPDIPADVTKQILAHVPATPIRLSDPQDHPIFRQSRHHSSDQLFPDWCQGCRNLLLVPIAQAESIYGMMILASDDDDTSFNSTDTKFLSLVAAQFRTALEHISLLADARKSYQRLREFQDQTVELEKLATRIAMSAEIGHDLNNFLAIVSGNLALIQIRLNKNKPEQAQKCIAKIEKAIEKMTLFTSNLMDPAATSTSRESIRLDALLREVVEFLSPQKRFEGISVSLPENLKSVTFEADSTQMQQVLYNLLNNAADAMHSSATKQITVTVLAAKPKSQFTITISDTGPGFTPDALKKLFRQQFTTKADGHGYGLSVCKRIIEQHNGTISVESPPGQGAVISLTLPLSSPTVEPAREEAAAHAPA